MNYKMDHFLNIFKNDAVWCYKFRQENKNTLKRWVQKVFTPSVQNKDEKDMSFKATRHLSRFHIFAFFTLAAVCTESLVKCENLSPGPLETSGLRFTSTWAWCGLHCVWKLSALRCTSSNVLTRGKCHYGYWYIKPDSQDWSSVISSDLWFGVGLHGWRTAPCL